MTLLSNLKHLKILDLGNSELNPFESVALLPELEEIFVSATALGGNLKKFEEERKQKNLPPVEIRLITGSSC